MAVAPRPLSPHLQVYRWTLSMAMSILHRASGVILSLGAVVLAIWLTSIAFFPDTYECLYDAAHSLPGKLALFGWTLAFFYHMGNGVRHLVWDAGYGFEIKNVHRGCLIVLAVMGIATAVTWIVAFNGVF